MPTISLNSPKGRALWRQMEADALNEAVSANSFSFPVLIVQSAASGFMCASVVREPGGQWEPITEEQGAPGALWPVRTLYVELATLRTAQHIFTEEHWRKACQTRQREQRRATATVPAPTSESQTTVLVIKSRE